MHASAAGLETGGRKLISADDMLFACTLATIGGEVSSSERAGQKPAAWTPRPAATT